ncbi:MAG: hypothetical protein CL693_12285 [Cellvibrionaceae bacterium]|nr:hypothetical protein [Cellvibrionaceae bacterium]|tara:strand:- start:6424 stop:7140 length:717 start_codon:yes stop_codon:yes gene_type:complete
MKNSLKTLALPAALLLSTGAQAEGSFFGSATATSDYRLFGLSQTLEDPAIQLEAGYDAGNGFFIGGFVSNVDFTPDDDPADGGEKLEADLFVGYDLALSETVSLTTTLIQYTYTGTYSGEDYDYAEIIFDLNTAFGTVTVGQSLDDFLGDLGADKALRVEYNHSIALADSGISLDLQLAHYDTDDAFGDSYNYYTVGFSGDLGPIGVSVGYNGTDSDGKDLFGDIADSTAFLSLTKEF